jgi:hypothetical protein
MSETLPTARLAGSGRSSRIDSAVLDVLINAAAVDYDRARPAGGIDMSLVNVLWPLASFVSIVVAGHVHLVAARTRTTQTKRRRRDG